MRRSRFEALRHRDPGTPVPPRHQDSVGGAEYVVGGTDRAMVLTPLLTLKFWHEEAEKLGVEKCPKCKGYFKGEYVTSSRGYQALIQHCLNCGEVTHHVTAHGGGISVQCQCHRKIERAGEWRLRFDSEKKLKKKAKRRRA